MTERRGRSALRACYENMHATSGRLGAIAPCSPAGVPDVLNVIRLKVGLRSGIAHGHRQGVEMSLAGPPTPVHGPQESDSDATSRRGRTLVRRLLPRG